MAQDCAEVDECSSAVSGEHDSVRVLDSHPPLSSSLSYPPFTPPPPPPTPESFSLDQQPPESPNDFSYAVNGNAADALVEEAERQTAAAAVAAVVAAEVEAEEDAEVEVEVEAEVGGVVVTDPVETIAKEQVEAAVAAAAAAAAAASMAVNTEQQDRLLQLQMLRERRLARHRAKRLRRAIERMAQGDRVELYDLSFEEKAQVAVAGFVAVMLAAPLVALLPRALRVTLLPAGALLALAFMLVAEIRSGSEQPPPPPPLSPFPPLQSSPLSPVSQALASVQVQPPLQGSAANIAALRRPNRLARPARAAIGPPYAIGGSRPKIVPVNICNDFRRPRSMATSSLTNTATFLSRSPDITSPSSYSTLQNYRHETMNNRDSHDSLGLPDYSFDDAPRITRTEIIESDKCPFHENEIPNQPYEFPNETDASGISTDVPNWMPDLPNGICPYRSSEHALDVTPVRPTDSENAEFEYSMKSPDHLLSTSSTLESDSAFRPLRGSAQTR